MLIVPTEFAMIQAALDSSADGDTVLIMRGIYSQSVMVPLHSVILAGEYLLSRDPDHITETLWYPLGNPPQGRTIRAFETDPAETLRIIGLSLRGGVSTSEREAGGISARGRSVEIEHCRIDSCYADSGGAVLVANGSLQLRDCRMTAVGSETHGAIVYARQAWVELHESDFNEPFHAPSQLGATNDQVWIGGDSLTISHCNFTSMGMRVSAGTQFIYPHQASTSVRITNCSFTRSRFHKFFGSERIAAFTPTPIEFDSNTVASNQFFIGFFATTDFDTGTAARFHHNRFISNTGIPGNDFSCRMFFDLSGTNCNVCVYENLFRDNSANEYSVASILNSDSSHVRFANNYIVTNSTHDALGNPPGGAVVLIGAPDGIFRNNVMVGNHPYAVFKGLLSFPITVARHNSWGHESGPSDRDENPLGLGDSVGDSIWVTPWYYDSSYVSVSDHTRPLIAEDFIFGNAYPNPFNATVTFEFAVLKSAQVNLEIVDVLGRIVTTLLDDIRSVGVHTIAWNPQGTASGVYFARLATGSDAEHVAVKKVLYLK